MATILKLAEQRDLIPITVPLDDDEQPERLVFGFPEFERWLDVELPQLEVGRLSATESPKEQVDFRLYQWIVGEPILYDRQFKDLMPMKDEVWEMKTVDTRIFGWIYRPCVFVAVFGDYADLYKGSGRNRSYENAKRRVLEARARLNLDEPKFLVGKTFDDLVSV